MTIFLLGNEKKNEPPVSCLRAQSMYYLYKPPLSLSL